MRPWNRNYWGVLGVWTGLTAVACQPTFTCKERLNCDPPPEVGAAQGQGGFPPTAGPNSGATGGTGGTKGSGGSNSYEPEKPHPAGGSSGVGGASGLQPRDCDPTRAPEEDPCVIHENFGVFVSPNGDDTTGVGSRTAPYRSLPVAIAANPRGRIYACAKGGESSDYDDAFTLTAAASGIQIYGGFDCITWTYNSKTKAILDSTNNTALTIDKASAVRLVDLDIRAASAPGASQNSVALFARSAIDLQLIRVRLLARKGSPGNTAASSGNPQPPARARAGAAGSKDRGGSECLATCSDGSSTVGGAGADAEASEGKDGESGSATPLTLSLPPANGSGGKRTGTCSKLDSSSIKAYGSPGGPGAAGDDGVGATVVGRLTELGWAPEPGRPGKNGRPGQGGGGGASLVGSYGAGGGGCGGCGGPGAKPGSGGGASISLLSWHSTISLEDCALRSDSGGAAGSGQLGPGGDLGGMGGLPAPGACAGGEGGNGGPGGASGGGAGGISANIVFSGISPILSGTALIPGMAGSGSPPLSREHPNTQGIPGISQSIFKDLGSS